MTASTTSNIPLESSAKGIFSSAFSLRLAGRISERSSTVAVSVVLRRLVTFGGIGLLGIIAAIAMFVLARSGVLEQVHTQRLVTLVSIAGVLAAVSSTIAICILLWDAFLVQYAKRLSLENEMLEQGIPAEELVVAGDIGVGDHEELREFSSPEWRIEIIEQVEALTVRAEMPGIRKEDLKITIAGDRLLTFEAECEIKEKGDRENSDHSEMVYSPMYRAVNLPVEVEGDKARAELKGGIVKVVLPKVKPGKLHKVEVA